MSFSFQSPEQEISMALSLWIRTYMYLIKRLEVLPALDQTTMTIACLLVEQIIIWHGVCELLSDCEIALLSLLDEGCLSCDRYSLAEYKCISPLEQWFSGEIQLHID